MSRTFRQVASNPSRSQIRPIRIVTYNVLAEKYSGNHAYCPKKFLDWSYRCQLLLQQLESYSPDLLCLQEVQEDVYQEVLQPWMLKHGYSSLYNPRPIAASSTTGGPMDGVSLHFRNDMFRLQDSQQVHFADYADQLLPGTCCSLHEHLQQGSRRHNMFQQALQQRQEGAVMALLEHKSTHQQLVACSTHLHWNPNFPDIKLAQAAILCHCISTFVQQQQQQQQQQREMRRLQQGSRRHQQQRHAGSQQDCTASMPIVVAGDFNSTWRKFASDVWDKVAPGESIISGVYELLSAGVVGPAHPDHPSKRRLCSDCSRLEQHSSWSAVQQQQQEHEHEQEQEHEQDRLLNYIFTTSGLQLESSQFSAYGREPTLTTRTSSFSGCLDYIWLSKQHWQVQSTLELPFKEPPGEPGPPDRVIGLGTCPNEHQPSDHLAIGCEAVLLPAVGAAGAEGAAAPGSSAKQARDMVVG